MRPFGAILLAMLVFTGCAKPDHDRLQGTWRSVSGERKGTQAPEHDATALIVVFTDDQVVMQANDHKLLAGKFTLDPAKTPKEADISVSEGAMHEKGSTVKCIYTLDGDSVRWCQPFPTEKGPGDRPKDFATKGTDNISFVLKREAAKIAESEKPAEKK